MHCENLGSCAAVVRPWLPRLPAHAFRSVPPYSPPQWVATLTGLEELTLFRAPGVPAGLERLTRLTHLALLRCPPRLEDWQMPAAAIKGLQALRCLRLYGTCLDGRHVKALAALGALQHLDLHESHVEELGWLAVRGSYILSRPLLLFASAIQSS